MIETAKDRNRIEHINKKKSIWNYCRNSTKTRAELSTHGKKWALVVPMEKCIIDFQSKIKQRPNLYAHVVITWCTNCTGDNSPKDTQTTTAENLLDDATFEQGDVHTIEITGGPTASMMSLEHPWAPWIYHFCATSWRIEIGVYHDRSQLWSIVQPWQVLLW